MMFCSRFDAFMYMYNETLFIDVLTDVQVIRMMNGSYK